MLFKIPKERLNFSWNRSSNLYSATKGKNDDSNTDSNTDTGTSTSSNSNSNRNRKKGSKGVYARPSAAIERGSGFFVPGLEGSRVRVLFGILVLVLSYINHTLSDVNITDDAAMHVMNTIDVVNTVQTDTVNNGIIESQSVVNEDALRTANGIATFYGTLLLMQGAIEMAKENGLGVISLGTTDNLEDMTKNIASDDDDDDENENYTSTNVNPNANANANTNLMQQNISPRLLEEEEKKKNTIVESIQWVAATYVALTPATHVLLLEDWIDDDDDDNDKNNDQQEHTIVDNSPSILYNLGHNPPIASLLSTSNSSSSSSSSPEIEIKMAITQALDTVTQSKGGRISIPSTNKASIALLPEQSRRCVLLQRIDLNNKSNNSNDLKHHHTRNIKSRRLCLLVGSDQLLPSFTKNDLKWLGQLGQYVSLKLE